MEFELFGGEVNQPVWVGDTVRRRTGPWATVIHSLLDHLHARGFPSPQVLGIDEQGREVLGYIPGRPGTYPWSPALKSDRGLVELGRLLRRYHDTVLDFDPGPDPLWRSGRRPLRPGEIVCHNDPGPWNFIWRRGHAVALLDFDLAGPGRVQEDVGVALWFAVPFRPDIRMIRFEKDPDRASRAAAFLRGYGWTGGEGAVDMVLEAMEKEYRTIVELNEAGVYPWTAFARQGLHLRNREHRAWVLKHRSALDA